MPGDLGVGVDVLQVPTERFTLKLLPQSRTRRDVTVVHFGHTWTHTYTSTQRSVTMVPNYINAAQRLLTGCYSHFPCAHYLKGFHWY